MKNCFKPPPSQCGECPSGNGVGKYLAIPAEKGVQRNIYTPSQSFRHVGSKH